jgi:polyisoprenoid-binding protein YceI
MKWYFEPGHTAAEFKARHMMVTWVRGHFKDVHGTLDFDPREPTKLNVDVEIDASKIWTGEPQRDAHLRSADFLDVEHFPKITFKGTRTELFGENDYRVYGDLTIRGITKEICLEVRYLGMWDTPWWEGGVDRGPKLRAGFVGSAVINRYDFNVSWNDKIPKNGVVVSENIWLTIDAEAVLDANASN